MQVSKKPVVCLLANVSESTTQFTRRKHPGLYMNNKGQIDVPSWIKGSTVLTLVWIFKNISVSCFGKKYITYLRWLFLTSLRFYELVRENLPLYGWFLHCVCTFKVLTSLSTGVTNRLFQVNEVNWLLLTFSWRLQCWDSDQSSVTAVIKVFM